MKLSSYKILLTVPIVVIVIVVVTVGIPSVDLLFNSLDYDIYVDAKINNQNSFVIGQVLIQNTGSQPLTNVKVDFGEGNILDVGTLESFHKLILTPPTENKMEFVTVYADQDIFVNKTYRDESLP